MKANNFRLGNLVMYDGRVFEIDTIANVFPTLNTIEFGIGVVDWNNIEPIQLTEEWLLKFGFVKRGLYYHFPNHDIFKLQQHKLNNAFWLRHSSESLDCVRINYVYQLQNLYFALTGEELTIM
jgi:hypothetical protein